MEKIHNEELHNFDSSPRIPFDMKSRLMRWMGRVAGIGKARNAYKILIWILHGNIT
jgi:hypothetical protein